MVALAAVRCPQARKGLEEYSLLVGAADGHRALGIRRDLGNALEGWIRGLYSLVGGTTDRLAGDRPVVVSRYLSEQYELSMVLDLRGCRTVRTRDLEVAEVLP
jgi:hypothetical protein